MRLDLRRTLLSLSLLGLLAVPVTPKLAEAQTPWADLLVVVPGTDATVYEATENLTYVGEVIATIPGFGDLRRYRVATSQLFGVARRGSPLCPGSTGPDCSLNMTGSDKVDQLTGLGSVTGTFTSVVQLPFDNPVDSPEFVVMKGKFAGKIDFTPIFVGLPFGTVTAKLVINGGGKFPFTGIFRQPVDVGPPLGVVYYTGAGVPPLNPLTDLTPVGANEFSLSYPTVRFEIIFGHRRHHDDDDD